MKIVHNEIFQVIVLFKFCKQNALFSKIIKYTLIVRVIILTSRPPSEDIESYMPLDCPLFSINYHFSINIGFNSRVYIQYLETHRPGIIMENLQYFYYIHIIYFHIFHNIFIMILTNV